MTAPGFCKDVRERLSALIENDLEPQARRAVEEHLLGCPDCRAERTALEKLLANRAAAAAMGRAGRRWAEAEASDDIMAQRTEQVYLRAVRGG